HAPPDTGGVHVSPPPPVDALDEEPPLPAPVEEAAVASPVVAPDAGSPPWPPAPVAPDDAASPPGPPPEAGVPPKRARPPPHPATSSAQAARASGERTEATIRATRDRCMGADLLGGAVQAAAFSPDNPSADPPLPAGRDCSAADAGPPDDRPVLG